MQKERCNKGKDATEKENAVKNMQSREKQKFKWNKNNVPDDGGRGTLCMGCGSDGSSMLEPACPQMERQSLTTCVTG